MFKLFIATLQRFDTAAKPSFLLVQFVDLLFQVGDKTIPLRTTFAVRFMQFLGTVTIRLVCMRRGIAGVTIHLLRNSIGKVRENDAGLL